MAAAKDAAHEAQLKAARNYGGATYTPPGATPPHQQHHHQHFGPMVISCERADLRPTPRGVMVYGEAGKALRTAPRAIVPRIEVIDELLAAVRGGVPPLHDGAWSRATMEVCLAMLESARTGKDVPMQQQAAPRRLAEG